MFFSASFWPLFWITLGSGAALTVLLSFLVATVPLPRRHRRPPLTAPEMAPEMATEMAPRHDEGAAQRVLVAGRK